MLGRRARGSARRITQTKTKECVSRRRMYSAIHEPRIEHVKVTCGVSGSITLSIHNPSPSSSLPTILYIPNLGPSSNPPSIPSSLLSPAHTTILIPPRWSPTHPFPIPLHDLLAAYEHITTSLLPDHQNLHLKPSSSSPKHHHHHHHHSHKPHHKLGIYGHGLGGTLATSLALTECRPGHKYFIEALAVRDGIFDWTSIATSTPPSPSPSPSSSSSSGGNAQNEQQHELASLYTLRTQLFRRPAIAFDAFASPVLFFRTAGLSIPRHWPGEPRPNIGADPNASTALNDFEDGYLDEYGEWVSVPRDAASAQDGKNGNGNGNGNGDGNEEEVVSKSRKSHLVFPPRNSGLRIPFARFGVSDGEALSEHDHEHDSHETGKAKGHGKHKGQAKKKKKDRDLGEMSMQAFLEAQAEDLAGLMHRSLVMHEGVGEGEAEDRVRLERVLDAGSEGSEEDEVVWASEFFRDVLG